MLVWVLAANCGCNSKPNPPARGTASPPSQRTVRISCPVPLAGQVVQRYGQDWASRNAARLEVVYYDPLAGPEAGPGADAWVIAPAQLAYWASADRLLHVPDPVSNPKGDYAWGDLLPVYQQKLLLWNRAAVALPLVGDGLACFYRADLFTEPRHREEFKRKHRYELAPPATWEQFADIAGYFQQQTSKEAGLPEFALPPLPEADDDLDREFYTLAASCGRRALRGNEPRSGEEELFSFHYDFTSGEPRIATPAFVYALQLLMQVQEFRPKPAAPEPAESFARGQAVLCLAQPRWLGRFRDSPIQGKVGVGRVPGSRRVFDMKTGEPQEIAGGNYVPYLGSSGWLGVVPRTSSCPDAAFGLLASLSDPKTSREVIIEPAWGGGVFRADHLQVRVGWQALGLTPGQTEVLVLSLRQMVAHPDMINPVLRLRTPDEREHQQALLSEIRAALFDGKDPSQALADAARRWRELDQRKDLKTRLAEYRLSLSLRPQQ